MNDLFLTYFNEQRSNLGDEKIVVRAIVDEYGRAWLIELVATDEAAASERAALELFAWDTEAIYATPASLPGRFLLGLVAVGYNPASHTITSDDDKVMEVADVLQELSAVHAGDYFGVYTVVDAWTQDVLFNLTQ